MIGTGKLTVVRGLVNTVMLPILQLTVTRDHPAYVPGNVLLINSLRYWIRARRPDEPTPGKPVELALYRDYTTRSERNHSKAKIAKLMAKSLATAQLVARHGHV